MIFSYYLCGCVIRLGNRVFAGSFAKRERKDGNWCILNENHILWYRNFSFRVGGSSSDY